jgi:hypothetical protein
MYIGHYFTLDDPYKKSYLLFYRFVIDKKDKRENILLFRIIINN